MNLFSFLSISYFPFFELSTLYYNFQAGFNKI